MAVTGDINFKDPATRLEIGRRVHEREWATFEEAAEVLGCHRSMLFTLQSEYRKAQGIVTQQMLAGGRPKGSGNKGVRASKVRAAAQALAPAAPAANGNGSHLTVVSPREDTSALRTRIAALEEEVEQLEHERAVLQKILMAVGASL